MPCGMEVRRVRNNLRRMVDDAYGGKIEPNRTGDVDPHDERVIAGIAAGDLTDLGPVPATAHTHPEEAHARARRP